mmetsp:Transcript_23515/g.56753  ORF Transcript_23515/g.56753 Transcript_23515/m.56753 type:complete len:158 (-) Transcript_23515:53-526(-)
MFVKKWPVRDAQHDADGNADTPGVKDVGEVLEEITIYPSYGSKEDDYVVEEIFRQFLPLIVHFSRFCLFVCNEVGGCLINSAVCMLLRSWPSAFLTRPFNKRNLRNLKSLLRPADERIERAMNIVAGVDMLGPRLWSRLYGVGWIEVDDGTIRCCVL